MLKLSIVTVTYNAAKVIDITAQSIAKFKNEYIEWIVIDGMSSDGTVELLKLYSDYIDLLVIEPDEGIFDAMNKAQKFVRGKHILFMNAGDKVINGDILINEFLSEKSYKNTVFIGDSFFYHNKKKYLKKIDINALDNINWTMPVIHQSMIIPINVLNTLGWYDTKYKVVSDFDLFIRIIQNGIAIKILDYPISEFYIGDYNWKNDEDAFIEKYHMLNSRYENIDVNIKLKFYLTIIKVRILGIIKHSKLYSYYRSFRYG